MRRACSCCLALLLVGCASANIMRLDSVERTPVVPASVQLFLDEPSRPYTAIALIEVSDQGWGLSLETLRNKLAKEAAKLGGQGVIIGRRTSQSGTYIQPVGRSFVATNIEVSGLVGKVIVFQQ